MKNLIRKILKEETGDFDWVSDIDTEQDFEDYCRFAYEKIQSACDFHGIINDEDYESFKERCYTQLETDYLNSIDRTIH